MKNRKITKIAVGVLSGAVLFGLAGVINRNIHRNPDAALNFSPTKQAKMPINPESEKNINARDRAVEELREKNVKFVSEKNLNKLTPENLKILITENLGLTRKVLKTQNEKDLEREIFKNREVVDLAISVLDKPDDEPLRMDAVEFLAKGLEIQKRYGGENMVQQVSEFLIKEYSYESLDLAQEKSIAADRVELFASLFHDYPEQAEEVLRDSTSKKLTKLYKFGKSFYASNKRGESL